MSRLEIDPGDRRNPVPPPPPSAKGRARFGGIAKAVAAALALAVLAWGVRYGGDYFGTPAAPPGPVPVIGPDAGPVKVLPDNPGGMNVPDQDKVILNGGNAQPKVEQLLPPPETPLASPGVQPPVAPPPVAPLAPPQASQIQSTPPQNQQSTSPPPQQTSPPPQQTSPQPQPIAPPPVVTSTVPRPAAPAQAIVPPPPPKPVMPSATPAPPPAAALPPGKGYFLQLGALRSVEAAQASWTELKAAQPDILGSLPANAVKADLGPDRGVYYRVMAGPIADETSATQSCNTLKERHVACILVKP